MINEMTKSQFISGFMEVRPEDFTYNVLGVLFDYYEDRDKEAGGTTRFDPIEICGLWDDWDIEQLVTNFSRSYGEECSDWDMSDWIKELSKSTTVLTVDSDTILAMSF